MGGEHPVTPGDGRRHSFLADAAFEQLKELIIRRTGHFYYQDKDGLLWERLVRRLRATGLNSTAEYLARLSDPIGGEVEWTALEAEITIGETFFFRYADQFAALRDAVLPAIMKARQESRRIRIWSAGCANGAEPYSVGILLRRMLGEEIDRWRISILGTDINEHSLEAARQGRFGNWALRAIPAEERESDFTPAPDRRSWLLKPQHRAMVRFERHNLLSLLDGTSPLQMSDFDLILCRNVLIYFHPETVPRIVRALGERLADDGWLLVGHAEPSPVFRDFLAAVDLPGTIAYRREPPAPKEQAPDPPPDPPRFPFLPPAPRVIAPPPRKASAEAPRPPTLRTVPEQAPAAPSTSVEADRLAAVRALADLGELDRAREACRAGLQADPTNAALHYYDGLIARALGDRLGAERAFRRAIYLQRKFLMAHYQLGLLLLESGRASAGRRAVANAMRLALGLPGQAVLEEGDGLTVAAFRGMARLHLAPRQGGK